MTQLTNKVQVSHRWSSLLGAEVDEDYAYLMINSKTVLPISLQIIEHQFNRIEFIELLRELMDGPVVDLTSGGNFNWAKHDRRLRENAAIKAGRCHRCRRIPPSVQTSQLPRVWRWADKENYCRSCGRMRSCFLLFSAFIVIGGISLILLVTILLIFKD